MNHQIKLREWVGFEEAVPALKERMMFREPRFVLDNWSCKYIDARIDMRTGAVYLTPGNTHMKAPDSNPTPSIESYEDQTPR